MTVEPKLKSLRARCVKRTYPDRHFSVVIARRTESYPIKALQTILLVLVSVSGSCGCPKRTMSNTYSMGHVITKNKVDGTLPFGQVFSAITVLGRLK